MTLRYINGLELTKADFIMLLWTISGELGRLILPVTSRAALFLKQHAINSSETTVVNGLAFASESDYIELCKRLEAEGYSRDEE